eukprot:CAMPEP_0175812614 /NCGR_PEP_ID=MMETSP0107_2-20121207/4469_1 /TAXON_ID=195067 ORGANISM="Goniomonas pacifica, Strain CCMP1869" /NCGR_SAMPLE_ID=MMETSP0107_2 /ASSEMBLY_ACC=CAM_ASM_000203 /LENGTH=301 /DNA_ID=CAMNT_0017124485 /DNA_START=12 /DNA_END=917 /DNA_ORIENTATION=-
MSSGGVPDKDGQLLVERAEAAEAALNQLAAASALRDEDNAKVVESLATQISDKDEELERLRSELGEETALRSEAGAQRLQLQQRAEQVGEEERRLRAKVVELEAAAEDVKEEHSQIMRRVAEERQKLNLALQQSEHLANGFREERDTATRRLEEAAAKRDDHDATLRREVEDAHEQAVTLMRERDEAVRKAHANERSASALKAEEEERRKAETRASDMDREILQLRSQLSHQRRKVIEAQQQLREPAAASSSWRETELLSQLQQRNEENGVLQKQITDARSEFQVMKKEIAELSAALRRRV